MAITGAKNRARFAVVWISYVMMTGCAAIAARALEHPFNKIKVGWLLRIARK
jgi:hypothetical protein